MQVHHGRGRRVRAAAVDGPMDGPMHRGGFPGPPSNMAVARLRVKETVGGNADDGVGEGGGTPHAVIHPSGLKPPSA